MHTGTENISMARVEEKTEAFEFIRNLLTLLLMHGLDPNVRFSQRSHHILLSLMDMVQNSRSPKDLNFVYSLTLTLLQYGANPNMVAGTGGSGRSRGQASYEQSRSAGRAHEHRRGRQENVFIRRQTNNQVIPCPSTLLPVFCGGKSDSFDTPLQDQVLFHYAQTLVNKDQLMADPEQSFARWAPWCRGGDWGSDRGGCSGGDSGAPW